MAADHYMIDNNRKSQFLLTFASLYLDILCLKAVHFLIQIDLAWIVSGNLTFTSTSSSNVRTPKAPLNHSHLSYLWIAGRRDEHLPLHLSSSGICPLTSSVVILWRHSRTFTFYLNCARMCKRLYRYGSTKL